MGVCASNGYSTGTGRLSDACACGDIDSGYIRVQKDRSMRHGEFSAGGCNHKHSRNQGRGKVFPTTDDPSRFKSLKNVFLDTGRDRVELEIEQVKFLSSL